MKKILNFNGPIINCLPKYNSMSAIINSSSNEYAKLEFIDNFIDIKYEFSDIHIWEEFYDYNHWKNFDTLDFSVINRSIFAGYKSSTVEFLCNAVDNDYYVFINALPYFNSAYETMRDNVYFPHEILVYGYDNEKRLFSCADFFNENYCSKTCGFDELAESIDKYENRPNSGFEVYEDDVILIKHNTRKKVVDINYVHKTLNSFLSSKKVGDVWPFYGYSWIDSLISSVSTLNRPVRIWLHEIALCFLREHIKLMINRMQYFNNGELDQSIQKCEQLLGIVTNCIMLLLKLGYATDTNYTEHRLNKSILENLSYVNKEYDKCIKDLILFIEGM